MKGLAPLSVGLILWACVWLMSGSPMNVTVTVKYTDGTPVSYATVILTDYLTGKQTTVVTDANGIAKASIPNFNQSWWMMKSTLPNGQPNPNFPSAYDVNHDGIINIQDVGYFAFHFGTDADAIGSVRIIVSPSYDKTVDVLASPYPQQTFTFSDVPLAYKALSTLLNTTSPTPTPTPWYVSIFQPPDVYYTSTVGGFLILLGGVMLVRWKRAK